MADTLPLPGELLPHKGMALVLDELTALKPGESATGLWTPGDEYFEGHEVGEDGELIFPGHWTMESVGLIAACALRAQDPTLSPRWKECRSVWRAPVMPGDMLEVSARFEPEVRRENLPGGIVMELMTGKGTAKVGKSLVYRAPVMTAIIRVIDPRAA